MTPYPAALAAQLHHLHNLPPTRGIILTTEHPPVITVGKNANHRHILIDTDTANQRGIDIHKTDRGGDVTLHSPGQLVVYPIFRLGSPRAVRSYVSMLEKTITTVLANHQIPAYPKPHLPGVWVAEKKIASIGIRIKNRATYHGLALNINNDLDLFTTINPCGLPDTKITSMQEILGQPISLPLVQKQLIDVFRSLHHTQ